MKAMEAVASATLSARCAKEITELFVLMRARVGADVVVEQQGIVKTQRTKSERCRARTCDTRRVKAMLYQLS